MLRLTQTKLVRGWLVAVYLIAACSGGLFHQHADGECHHGQQVCTDHDHGHCGYDHADHRHTAGHDHADETAPAQPGKPLSDDDCAVCRFLALASLPTVPVALPVMGNLVVAANPAEPRHESRTLELTLHSRAPPVATL